MSCCCCDRVDRRNCSISIEFNQIRRDSNAKQSEMSRRRKNKKQKTHPKALYASDPIKLILYERVRAKCCTETCTVHTHSVVRSSFVDQIDSDIDYNSIINDIRVRFECRNLYLLVMSPDDSSLRFTDRKKKTPCTWHRRLYRVLDDAQRIANSKCESVRWFDFEAIRFICIRKPESMRRTQTTSTLCSPRRLHQNAIEWNAMQG